MTARGISKTTGAPSVNSGSGTFGGIGIKPSSRGFPGVSRLVGFLSVGRVVELGFCFGELRESPLDSVFLVRGGLEELLWLSRREVLSSVQRTVDGFSRDSDETLSRGMSLLFALEDEYSLVSRRLEFELERYSESRSSWVFLRFSSCSKTGTHELAGFLVDGSSDRSLFHPCLGRVKISIFEFEFACFTVAFLSKISRAVSSSEVMSLKSSFWASST